MVSPTLKALMARLDTPLPEDRGERIHIKDVTMGTVTGRMTRSEPVMQEFERKRTPEQKKTFEDLKKALINARKG